MRLWKYLLIAVVVAGGYWIGYTKKDQKALSKPTDEPDAPIVASADTISPASPQADPTLILPPVPEQGVMIDMPIGDIGKHFRDKAGLKAKDETGVEGPILLPSEPKRLSIDLPPEPTDLLSANWRGDFNLPSPGMRPPAPQDDPDRSVKMITPQPHRSCVYVSERDLRLNFDVTKRGNSGIMAVELWARRSTEKDYECVDRMLGDKPPLATRLGSDGHYEFRIVLVSGSGARSTVPSPSDLPDACICLDTMPPTVELLSPSSDQAGIVRLRWKAEDRNLDEQPIRLFYSVDGDIWNPVNDSGSWLPNTGTYAWKVPAYLPHDVHLRVVARDRAGNIGESKTPSKISVDLTLPEGRISGVVELGPKPRTLAPELANTNQ